MALKNTIYSLLAPLLSGETLIFLDQNAPRPPLPYWTMQVSTRRSLGRDSYSQGVTDAGHQTVYGTREATVMLQRIGEDSDTKMQDLRDLMAKTSVQESWRVAHIAPYNMGDVKNIPYPLDQSQLEPRAAMDLFVRFDTQLVDTAAGVIEQVDIEAALGDNDDLTEIVTVVLS